ncbi:MAG: GDSL-type esterase/lipase family protein [Betaproteobacteria bacterium]
MRTLLRRLPWLAVLCIAQIAQAQGGADGGSTHVVTNAVAAMPPLHMAVTVAGGRQLAALRCAAPSRGVQTPPRAAEGGTPPAGSDEEELPLSTQQENEQRLEALPAPTPDDIRKAMPHEEWIKVMHQRIQAVASSRVARIGVWGGSHMAAEYFVGELRRIWQGRYGAGGPGHVNLLYGLPGIRLPVNAMCRQGRWQHEVAPRAMGAAQLSAGLGLFVVNSREAGAFIEVDPGNASPAPVRTMTLHFLRQPEGGLLTLMVDDVAVGQIDTKGPLAVGSVQINGMAAISRLKLVAQGREPVGLLGVYAEAEHGVVLDNFGIAGASGAFWTTVYPELMQQASAQHPYELVMLAYGTNDVTGAHWDPQDYRRRFESTLEAMRLVMPQALCVLITPGDRASSSKVRSVIRDKNGRTRKVVQTRYDLKTFPQRHMEAARIQRELGERHQCVTWDMSLEMRKVGGAYELMMKNPPWMARDLIHLTPLGYQEMARAYAKWLRL